MSMMRLAGGNGHNEESLPRFVQAEIRKGAAAVAAFESQKQRDDLGSMRGTRLLECGPSYEDPRIRATSIVTADRHRRIGALTRQVSEQLDAFERVAPNRALVCEMFEHPITRDIKRVEGVAFFALHPDAGPEALNGDDKDHPIVREYRESLVSTAEWMASAEDDGLLCVLSGDLQVGRNHNRPWGPDALLARPLELTPVVHGIDWMLVDRRLVVADVDLTRLFNHTAISIKAVAA